MLGGSTSTSTGGGGGGGGGGGVNRWVVSLLSTVEGLILVGDQMAAVGTGSEHSARICDDLT